MDSVVILGAGLAGLSAAWHLGSKTPWSLFERQREVGGLARTISWEDGCRFDYTGHLLHASDPAFDQLLDRLLPGALATHRRVSAVQSHGIRTPYPFQANTHGLPPEVVTECLLGFAEARAEEARREEITKPGAGASMAHWVDHTFGAGFEKHFFRPYNEKLYRTPLEGLATDWATWSVPVPSLEEVVGGALGTLDSEFGYNATFRYPASGGISALPDALARGLCRPAELGREAVAVDPDRRLVRFDDGGEEPYGTLVSTMPLPHLLGMLRGGEHNWAAEAAGRLRAVSVVDVNLAVDREAVLTENWVYFPEPEFAFYRVGCFSSFATGVAPAGVSTLYAEVSVPPGESPSLPLVQDQVLDGLVRAGILGSRGEVLRSEAVHIDPAYVIHDQQRCGALDEILQRLERMGIISTGRYGRWHYGTMQSAVLDGREAAGRILARETGGGK